MAEIKQEVYDELNQLFSENFQVLVNKDGSPRELFKNNVSVRRNFKGFSKENVLEILENNKDPFFILNNFSGGDIKYR